MKFFSWAGSRLFNMVHGRNLVYNTCWEDPRLDRVAMELGPDDTILVITSAGCNALDYLLDEPKHVYAVDMNPRQNALLDLKISGIKNLDFETFFQMFGQGALFNAQAVYHEKLRASLPEWSQKYWDRYIKFFIPNKKKTFYFRGTSGAFARLINIYINKVVKLRPEVDAILDAKTVEQQREIFDKNMKKKFWKKSLRFFLSRNSTLSMLGVPPSQRDHLENHYEGGIAGFIEDCLEAVFAELPISDNYFWRVYTTGTYTKDCCPNYLKEENFNRLKDGLIDRVSTHTASVQQFLDNNDVTISRYVLLDHMDWLCDQLYPLLEQEWNSIVQRAAPETRILWRSGGTKTDFVDEVQVEVDGQTRRVGDMLKYHEQQAAELHPKDRVHTYGSFFIADLKKD